MKHARYDYDRIQDPAGLIPEDEPVFLIRGQDRFAVEIMQHYAELCRLNGVDCPLILEQIVRMKNWPVKKTPDGPEGHL